jgi:hypothetical protein
MNFKDMMVFTILMTVSILFGIMVIKTAVKKNENNVRTIEYIDPDYDKKYPKSF